MHVTTAILPHHSEGLYLTDGGLETTLVFLEGFDLPCFAAFDLLKNEKGYSALKKYYKPYLELAVKHRSGFILETPTWRANPDWIQKIGYPAMAIRSVNEKAVELMKELKQEYNQNIKHLIMSGCIGPRGDGYLAHNKMTIEESEHYHAVQIKILKLCGVDMVSAVTMTYPEEAAGICYAAAEENIPAVVSFTVETDGKLPCGISIKDAIEYVDEHSKTAPIYYMINCAHPSHFKEELLRSKDEDWTKRIRGTKANASCRSHAELDESTSLDRGIPAELAAEHKSLFEIFPHINVVGGCCGTDEEHVSAIADRITERTAVV